ncbi:hypothetical protein GCM10023318_29160 [Nocardia callitridis]|uniref:Antigen 84 n=1 Tax=Nocardia callitridis TaxID=648753 RepID=A0ABP9KCC4_9NOCA
MKPEDPHRIRFSAPSSGQRGYHADEVDAYLTVVAATMNGEGTLVADDLRRVTFDVAPADGRGYRADEVDDYLDRARVELEHRQRGTRPSPSGEGALLTHADVHQVHFGRAPLGKQGYREDDVDDLLDRIADTLAHRRPGSLTAAELRKTRLRRKRFGGYRLEEVDAFLALAKSTLGSPPARR